MPLSEISLKSTAIPEKNLSSIEDRGQTTALPRPHALDSIAAGHAAVARS